MRILTIPDQNRLLLFAGNSISAFYPALYLVFFGLFIAMEEAGRFALAQALVFPVFVFLSMGMRSYLSINKIGKLEAASLMKFRFISIFTIFMVFYTVILFLYDQQVVTYCVVLWIIKTSDQYFDMSAGIYIEQDNLSRLAKSQLFRSLSSLAFGLSIGYLTTPIIGLSSHAAVSIFVQLIDWKKHSSQWRRDSDNEFKPDYLVNLIKIGLPTAFSSLFMSYSFNVPRLAIERQTDSATFGQLSLLLLPISLANQYLYTLGQTHIKGYALHCPDGTTNRLRLAQDLRLSLLLSSVLVMLSPLVLLFPDSFSHYRVPVVIFLLFSIFSNLGSILGYYLFAVNEIRPMLLVSAFALLLSSIGALAITGMISFAIVSGLISAYFGISYLLIAFKSKGAPLEIKI